MFRIFKKQLPIFALLLSVVFIGSIQNANAWQITITIYTGSGIECRGFGICKIIIDASLKTATSPSGDNVIVLKGDAEIKGNKLVIKFQDKLDERMKGDNGKYSLTIGSDFPSIEVSKDESGNEVIRQTQGASFGERKDKASPKLYKVIPGDYEIKGNTLTLKVKHDTVKNTIQNVR